jgi:iron complex outermembrane receptor protein
MWSFSFLSPSSLTQCAVIVFKTFTKDLTCMHMFHLVLNPQPVLFMKIFSARKATLPLLLVPLFSPLTPMGAEEQTMIVSATPQTVSELDTPAAVSVVNGDDMRQARRALTCLNRLAASGTANSEPPELCQDLQLSMRGFGARSTFGVRGIRMYVDGIPATMPDGQGQTSTSISSGER